MPRRHKVLVNKAKGKYISSRSRYSIIEEIEREVRRLFGNNDISMPIIEVPNNDFLQIIDNIEPKRKIVVIRKRKNDSIST